MDYELMMNGNVKIGQKAPDFNAISTFGDICLNEYKGKWLVFFSHPRRLYSGNIRIFGWINKSMILLIKVVNNIFCKKFQLLTYGEI